jgi:hypothetical protein
MQCELGVDVCRGLVEVALGAVVDDIVRGESIELVKLVGHQHFWEWLVLTRAKRAQFCGQLWYAGIQSWNLIGLTTIRLE